MAANYLYYSHLSRFQTICPSANNNYKMKKTIKIKFVWEINQFSRFKMAAIPSYGRFTDFTLALTIMRLSNSLFWKAEQ